MKNNGFSLASVSIADVHDRIVALGGGKREFQEYGLPTSSAPAPDSIWLSRRSSRVLGVPQRKLRSYSRLAADGGVTV